jgi:hypothetical protein
VPYLRMMKADLVITEHAIALSVRPLRLVDSSGSRGREVFGFGW